MPSAVDKPGNSGVGSRVGRRGRLCVMWTAQIPVRSWCPFLRGSTWGRTGRMRCPRSATIWWSGPQVVLAPVCVYFETGSVDHARLLSCAHVNVRNARLCEFVHGQRSASPAAERSQGADYTGESFGRGAVEVTWPLGFRGLSAVPSTIQRLRSGSASWNFDRGTKGSDSMIGSVKQLVMIRTQNVEGAALVQQLHAANPLPVQLKITTKSRATKGARGQKR